MQKGTFLLFIILMDLVIRLCVGETSL